MTKRVHFTISGGQNMDGEYDCSSACGLNEDSNAEWNGTGTRDKVTCKRCLAKMARPKAVLGASKEKPILFTGPMIRAILEGRKTVTRRAVKGHHLPRLSGSDYPGNEWKATAHHHPRHGFNVFGATETECAAELTMYGDCPYGRRGHRLWVRETFIDLRGTGVEHRPDPDGPLQRYAYAADCRPGSYGDEARKDFGLKYKPSIHMPRAACRILLEITDVRVERLQNITEDQAKAEGCFFIDYGRKCGHTGSGWTEVGDCPAPEAHHPQRNGWMWDKTSSSNECLGTATWAFANLWQSVGGSWDMNPWVWVVEFKRVTP